MNPINPDLFTFYKQLSENNNREWFDTQKPRFKALETEIKAFADALKTELNRTDEIDQVKVFRIYRDVRFSKNKAPYKTHTGIAFHRKKPQLRGGYYIHIAPGDVFIATGFWDPNKEDLLRIRKEIEADADEFRSVIAQADLKAHWGALEGEEVKTAPKGFSKEHPAIDLIRKKQYLFIKKFSDQEVFATDFDKQVRAHFKAVRPFLDYMTSVLTTDLNGVSLL